MQVFNKFVAAGYFSQEFYDIPFSGKRDKILWCPNTGKDNDSPPSGYISTPNESVPVSHSSYGVAVNILGLGAGNAYMNYNKIPRLSAFHSPSKAVLFCDAFLSSGAPSNGACYLGFWSYSHWGSEYSQLPATAPRHKWNMVSSLRMDGHYDPFMRSAYAYGAKEWGKMFPAYADDY